MESSPSSECFHALDGECVNPLVRGAAEPSRCSKCEHYRGPIRGLGDVVATVTKSTGIDRLMKAVNPNCGCAQRRAALNAAVPFPDREER